MTKMTTDQYEAVSSQEYEGRRSRDSEYSLRKLDKDFLLHLQPHLHLSGDEPDYSSLMSLRRKPLTTEDVIDSRGTFLRTEVRKELRKLGRTELEGRLGISSHKLDEILRRAEVRTKEMAGKKMVHKGEIKYKAFIEVVREYRLNTEQETKLESMIRVFAFVEEFSCSPPTLVMLGLTLLELVMFVYTCVTITQSDSRPLPITWTGPVPYCSYLIYNPRRRGELWRFLSYMFVHIGVGHFFFNMLMQVLVGVFLEMEQEGWVGSIKVLTVYMCGVLAGSLGTSLSDPDTYIAGASGGVYALIAAHLATLTLNWQEDGQVRIQKVVQKPITKIIRIIFILVLTIHDIVFAVYVRIYDPENRTGFMGHLCGALAGLTVGLFILDNRRVRPWEPVVQWLALLVFAVFVIFCTVWNFWGEDWSPGFFPPTDHSLYEEGGSCSHSDYI